MSNATQIYCVKEKRFTPNVPGTGHIVMRKNGRRSLVAKCASCGIQKQKFVAKDFNGAGILGNLLGLPNGKIPLLSDLPLVGALF